jgi:hypothetical protein
MADLVNRYALKVKLNKLEHQSVFIQVLLSELLNKSGVSGATLVQGYCTVYGESCYHVWVEDDKGTSFDVTKKLFKEFDIPDFKLTKEPIVGAQKDQLTVDHYELYKSDPKEFWKKASRKFLEFRAKCHIHLAKTGRL